MTTTLKNNFDKPCIYSVKWTICPDGKEEDCKKSESYKKEFTLPVRYNTLPLGGKMCVPNIEDLGSGMNDTIQKTIEQF
jgi:hypothetical protein